jgi:hypothetical protein
LWHAWQMQLIVDMLPWIFAIIMRFFVLVSILSIVYVTLAVQWAQGARATEVIKFPCLNSLLLVHVTMKTPYQKTWATLSLLNFILAYEFYVRVALPAMPNMVLSYRVACNVVGPVFVCCQDNQFALQCVIQHWLLLCLPEPTFCSCMLFSGNGPLKDFIEGKLL